ncbi:MAG: 8-oxo-dGTP diphosphatase [Lachnospiraceae bacterium]|nr:8-oxo-dGTP diphosphatase [Lachnospiraceae bacterium]
MKNTTLCYIEKDDKYLMLLRNKKEKDVNKGKWIGVGGHFEEGESPVECLIREVKEETGLTLLDYCFRGIVTFVSNECETEYMHLYTTSSFEGEIKECDEGQLEWIKKADIMALNLWDGDRIFLKELMNNKSLIDLKLIYEGDKLVRTENYREGKV